MVDADIKYMYWKVDPATKFVSECLDIDDQDDSINFFTYDYNYKNTMVQVIL